MFFYFFILLSLFFFLLNTLFSNLFIWWSIFVLMTLIFLFINKMQSGFSSGLNYFIIQETLGLLFLVFLGSTLQFFILMMKVGVSPFHFWVYSVVQSLDSHLLMWFLTFQKLPFLPVFLFLFSAGALILIFFGIFICYLQIFILKNFKLMFFISSTESFSWIILGGLFGVWSFFFLFFYYFMNMVFLISSSSLFGIFYINLETLLVFLNFPLTVSFFLKIFMLYVGFSFINFYLLFLLFFMFLFSLSFTYWMVYFSLFSESKMKSLLSSGFFLIYMSTILILLYHFSKINYITLMGWSSLKW